MAHRRRRRNPDDDNSGLAILLVLGLAAGGAWLLFRKPTKPTRKVTFIPGPLVDETKPGPAVTPGDVPYTVPVDWNGRPRPGEGWHLERDMAGRATWVPDRAILN